MKVGQSAFASKYVSNSQLYRLVLARLVQLFHNLRTIAPRSPQAAIVICLSPRLSHAQRITMQCNGSFSSLVDVALLLPAVAALCCLRLLPSAACCCCPWLPAALCCLLLLPAALLPRGKYGTRNSDGLKAPCKDVERAWRTAAGDMWPAKAPNWVIISNSVTVATFPANQPGLSCL